MFSIDWLAIFALTLLLGSLLSWRCASFLTDRITKAGNTGASGLSAGSAIALPPHEKMRPAEIAYLIRDGDLSHAIVVMAVDLLQRAVKEEQLNSPMPKLAEYESGMWRIAVDNVKSWAIKKADIPTTLSSAMKVDPNKLLQRAASVLKFFTTTLRAFIEKVVQDPRHIRKYISVAGVMRLVADFISAGYQRALEEELKKSLLKRGLLVPEKERMSCARTCATFFALNAFLVVAVEVAFKMPIFQAVIFALLGLMAAMTVRIIFHLRHYLPYYMDAIKLVEQISREGVRLKFIRLLLNGLRTVTHIAAALLFALLLLICSLVARLMFPALSQLDFMALVLVSGAQYISADLLVRAWRWMYEERPTPQATSQIEQVRAKVEMKSPLETMKNMLQTPEYDETFSELLSIYGIEALVILM